MNRIIENSGCLRYLLFALNLFSVCTPHSVLASVVPPQDMVIDFSATVDLYGQSFINQKIYGGFDTDNPERWGGNGWVCLSETDPTYGACVTNMGNRPAPRPTIIKLRLKERRSGITTLLNLRGLQSAFDDLPDHYNNANVAINYNKVMKTYYGELIAGKFITVATGNSEDEHDPTLNIIDFILIGGVWEGVLKLQERDANNQKLATVILNVTFNITDTNHIDIYFPEFGTAAPLVPLNIHPTSGANPTPGGQDVTNLDMCLYDGFNVNSSKYEVLLEDGNHHTPAGRPMGWFSVYRDGGDENQPRDRIDYQVRMNNPETDAMMNVRNGELITWNAVNTHRVRPVRLPSISYPVLCAPTPLELRVNKFATADKNAGQYHGTLRVTFTPTTTTL